jgi:alpha-glucoside transport system ATP-binding protein
MLELAPLLDRRPRALSGGQRQRVSIGRAVVRDPGVLLLDEPLSNLDAALRVRMRHEFARLHQRLGTTMVYVTHDQLEAMTLANRIVVMANGRVEQVGEPLDLYARPASLHVARMIGSPAMNIMPVTVKETGAVTTVSLVDGKSVIVPISTETGANGKSASFGVRPEDLTIATGEDYLFEGKVSIVEALGEVTLLYIEGLSAKEPIIAKLPGIIDVKRGDTMRFSADRQKLHLFDADGQTYRR